VQTLFVCGAEAFLLGFFAKNGVQNVVLCGAVVVNCVVNVVRKRTFFGDKK
jgi:hypothetical protein